MNFQISFGSRSSSKTLLCASLLPVESMLWLKGNATEGAFVWDQSGIRVIEIMRVSVCLGAILIPEYLDFHSGYSALRSSKRSRGGKVSVS